MSEEEEEGDFWKTVDFRGFRRQGGAEGRGLLFSVLAPIVSNTTIANNRVNRLQGCKLPGLPHNTIPLRKILLMNN